MAEEKDRRSTDPTEAVRRLRESASERAELKEEEIKLVDKLYFDPSERAEWVHTLLTQAFEEFDAELTDWDLLCFAVEWTGQQAIAIQDEQFVSLAKETLRWIYGVHYNAPEKLYGKPEKKDLPNERTK